MAMLAAVNYDPDAIEQPERFDLQCHPNRHLVFGTGNIFVLATNLRGSKASARSSVV